MDQPLTSPVERLEMILQQIDALPTLSPVAVRVLELTEAEGVDLREIARVIESDPALTGRILALCRRADKGIAGSITTVDRAAVMLGLEAVRAALLSVEVYELFKPAPQEDDAALKRLKPSRAPAPALDRRELWRHCMAVACAAELLAEEHKALMGRFRPQEAFLAGLLHDVGKLALDAVLPRTFARVVEMAETRQMNIAEVERRVLGLDHHTAGKRLGEHWGLPHALQDVMWLHGQSGASLPNVPHKPLIGVVTVADAIARRLYLGWSGNFAALPDFAALCREHGLDPIRARAAEAGLQDRLAHRAADLGLDDRPAENLLLECIGRANRRLGHLNAILDRRARWNEALSRTLDSIASFHARSAERRNLAATAGDIARSAAELLGQGFYAVILQSRAGVAWTALRLAADGRVLSVKTLDGPGASGDLADAADGTRLWRRPAPIVQWLGGLGLSAAQNESLRALLLSRGSGMTALLLHDRPDAEEQMTAEGLGALAVAWGAALVSAAQHDGARRLSEQLADANRRLTEAQSQLVEASAMAKLGEMAAGAAHEMNNPLTVISGQAQLLVRGLKDPHASAARTIVEASEKLSELITSLNLVADPPAPDREPTNLLEVLNQSAKLARQRLGLPGPEPDAEGHLPSVRVAFGSTVPPAWIDGGQITLAVAELILNALQSDPKGFVEVRVHIDPFDDRLMISVVDDGSGMSEHALRHACDPFFSDLPAGRRTGLGLTRARRFVELHGGELVLESEPGRGTAARIVLPRWRIEAQASSEAA